MNRIRELRESHGMTQGELGARLNVKGGAVSKYEKGQIEIGLSILEKLSEIFGVSIDYIVNNPNANLIPQEISAPRDEKDSELVAMSKNLDGENYKTAVKVIKLLTENAERNKKPSLSEDEAEIVNIYRFLDKDRKQRARDVLGDLKIAAANSRIETRLPSGSNVNHVEIDGLYNCY